METTLTITAKGQITLRKELLRHLGVAPGDKVAVDLLPSGRAEIRPAKSPASIEGFIGSLRQPDSRALSLEEIARLAEQGWEGRHR